MRKVMRQKKVYLFLLIFLVVAAVILYLAAKYNREHMDQEKAAGEKDPPMKISIGMWDIKEKLIGDELQNIIENKFNIELVPVDVNYMNWTVEFQKMAASGTLPDIIINDIVGTSTYDTWIKQGIIAKIPDDLSAYPNLEEYIAMDYHDYFRNEKGELHCIPRITYKKEESWALDRCIIVRSDWMEKLGINMPQSYEEFEDMLYRFTTEDPDGNGIDDTGGLSIVNMNMYEALNLSIFPELSNVERGWIKEKGQWMPVYCSEKTGEALSYAKRLYEKGLLDSDFAYQDSEEARKRFALGKSGAIASQYLGIEKIWEEHNPKTSFTEVAKVMHPWPASDGNTYRFTTSLHWSETYINGNVNQEKYDRILAFYDYLLSDEMEQMIEKYTVEECPSSDIFSILVKWNQDNDYLNKGKYRNQYSQEVLSYANQELEWYKENTVRVDYNWDIIFLNSAYKNQLPSSKEIQSEMIKVIIGKEDAITAWTRALTLLRAKTTLDQAIDEVTTLAKDLGL